MQKNINLINTFRGYLCLTYFGIHIIDAGEMNDGEKQCLYYKFSVPEFPEIDMVDTEVAKVIKDMPYRTDDDLINIAAHIIREEMVLSSLINDEELVAIATEEKREIVNRDVRLFAKVRKDEKWSEFDGVQTILTVLRSCGRIAGIK